jgi:hypothetical protein
MKCNAPSKQSPMLNLPLEIVHHEFFPYLDYATRVTVNSLLPAHDRKRTPLKKDSLDEFDICFRECIIKRFIMLVQTKTPAEILAAFRRFDLRNLTALDYSKYIRKDFIDSQVDLWVNLTYNQGWKMGGKLRYILREYNDYFLRHIRTLGEVKYYPFQYEFTAVTGVGYPIIVVKHPNRPFT